MWHLYTKNNFTQSCKDLTIISHKIYTTIINKTNFLYYYL